MSKRRIRDLMEFGKPSRVEVERDATGRLTKAVLHGVKVLGTRSANKNPDGTVNTYPLEARRAALPLYDGALVNVDHPKSRREPRSYASRIGRIRKPEARADGTFGELHLNPQHALAEQLVWDAQNAPDSLGLSHVAQGRGRIKGSDCEMEAIVEVDSVDVVGRAATTKGLFEGLTTEEESMDPKELAAILADTTLDADAKLAKLAELIAAASEEKPEDEPAAEEGAEAEKGELVGAGAKEGRLVEAMKRVDALELKLAARDQKDLVDRLIAEAKLPDAAVTQTFRETLYDAKDEKRVRALIEDRRGGWGAATGSRPVARDPGKAPAAGKAPTAPVSPVAFVTDPARRASYGLSKKEGR